jgi:hypothetical protein
MNKQIPIYFDTIILDSPIQEVSLNGYSDDVGSRLQVAVFTKYGNRNGSYITDEYADSLIASATRGDTPVVGFFDPESQTWASHTGPTLANGYGYIESFIGWKPLQDTDGVTREYAVFSVVLFTKYYEEARKIRGQNQSMELNPETIDGKWIEIEGEEYFAYTKGDMLGLCVIGAHEPCFSVSTFFSKNDDSYRTQYQKFASLVADLKLHVDEQQNEEGGEQQMDNIENQVLENVEPVVEDNQTQEDENSQFQAAQQEPETEPETVQSEPEAAEPTEYELLQQKYDELQTTYNELQANYEAAQNKVAEFEAAKATVETELDQVRAENAQLQATIATYEQQVAEAANVKKAELFEKYEKIITNAEEIEDIKKSLNDYSYDELNSKLAIIFANQQMASSEHEQTVPLLEPAESQFALLMKKYRKN